jgi:hypothetical protein
MNMFASTAVGVALPATAFASKATLTAPEKDPIFALIDAHKLAQTKLRAAEATHAAAEKDMQARGLLFPKVSSPGKNFPRFGMVDPHTCSDHEQIDYYCPVDIWPDENAREHAGLDAMIAQRDAVCGPTEQAMDGAYDAALETLDTAVETVPTTMAGVMALLEFQRDLWELNNDMFDRGHVSFICESVETALQNLRTA